MKGKAEGSLQRERQSEWEREGMEGGGGMWRGRGGEGGDGKRNLFENRCMSKV